MPSEELRHVFNNGWLHQSLRITRHYRQLTRRTSRKAFELVRANWFFVRWILAPETRKTTRKIRQHRHAEKTSPPEITQLALLPTVYINLSQRTDRRPLVEAELERAGLKNWRRFEAVKNSPGILGCTQSHAAVIEEAIRSNFELVLICEDDIELVAGHEEIQSLVHEFVSIPALDVLCLSYRLRGPKQKVTERLAVANNIQTTACYLVKRKALGFLLQSFRESEEMLVRGVRPEIAALDIHWKGYQSGPLLFTIPLSPGAKQRPSFSDVAGSFKDYGLS